MVSLPFKSDLARKLLNVTTCSNYFQMALLMNIRN